MIKIIKGIAVIISALMLTQMVEGHLYGGNRWSTATVDLCYDSFSLSYLDIGATAAMSQLDKARNDWNNQPSRFTLNKIDRQFCTHWNYAANHGTTGPNAVTIICIGSDCTYPFQSGYITDVDTEYNYKKDWETTRQCTNPNTNPQGPFTLEYTARHEFGHWIWFKDVYDDPSTTVMYYNYSCLKDSVKPHDSVELSQVYG